MIQLGEDPSRVFCLGALGAENCLFIDEMRVPDGVRQLPEKGYFTVLFHPETLSGANTRAQIVEVLAACDTFPDRELVFLGSNADTHSDEVRGAVSLFVASHPNARYFENLRTSAYHYLVKHSICLVGNSSSGLIEAPSLGTWTVNIGDRQAGRVRGASVMDVPCSRSAIKGAMRAALVFQVPSSAANPYYKPDCAQRYYETTLELLGRLDRDCGAAKKFYDLPVL